MGQKSNLTTTRNSYRNFNFLTQNNENYTFIFLFKKLVNRLFFLKGILITESTYNFTNNQLFCFFKGYISFSKIRVYKRKHLKKIKLNIKPYFELKNFFIRTLRLLKINFILFKFLNLNLSIDKKFLQFWYLKLKFAKRTLFARRHFLFIDFLGLLTLFTKGEIKSSAFLQILGEIFRVLPVRRQRFFFNFLKIIFTELISKNLEGQNLYKSKIRGIKFLASGKLQGKPRSSTSILQVGPVPIQSIDKTIEYSSLNVYTIVGSFGLKLWVYKN